jgi:tetratricopeptide (TPR) repeat protein
MRRQLAIFFARLNQRRRLAARRRTEAPPRSLAQRLRGWFFYCAYVVVAAAAILFAAELVLLAAHAMTGSEALQTLDQGEYYAVQLYPEYPADPDTWTKVAVFGGSTAAGDHSTRRFSDVIEHDLKKLYPDHKIFVKNYARPGFPFHRHEAEYVKLLIDRYDVFIIYCGNNEAENYYDDVGYWRREEYKDARDLIFSPPVEARSGIMSLLEKNSRLFALASRVKGRIEAPISKNKPANYDEIEEHDALPPEERKAIVTNFERDVVEICELAASRHKQILIAGTASHETWPPCCSVFQEKTPPQQREKWKEIYQAGMAEFEAENYKAALPVFEQARQIDAGVAILNYRIGLCHLKLGDPETGRRYLIQAIDQDGFHSRSITPVHDKAKELSKKYDCLHYVDVVARMHEVLRGGVADEEVFSDHCHMRLLGHVIVGRIFLDKLLELEPFSSWQAAEADLPDESDWRALADYYHEELGVTLAEESHITLSRIFSFFNMAYWTAYPQRCYDQIAEQTQRLEDITAKQIERRELNPWDAMAEKAMIRLCRARLALREGDYDLATRKLNEAWGMSPEGMQAAMSLPAYYRYVHEEFESAGIVFDPKTGTFQRTQNAAELKPDDRGVPAQADGAGK